MLTVKEFKKLSNLENQGYYIYVDGEEVHGLHYDEDIDWHDFVDGCEEMLCNFTFVDDRYTTVQDLREFVKGKWTVEQHLEIDWKAIPDYCNCKDADIDWDGFGGGTCRKCGGHTF